MFSFAVLTGVKATRRKQHGTPINNLRQHRRSTFGDAGYGRGPVD
jgi:hypothetical protein